MLALIAGQGALPGVIAPKAGLIAALEGTPTTVEPDLTFRIETLGTLLATLKDKGVTEVCFAGGVTRPRIDGTKLDAATRPLAERLVSTANKGDDSALRIILDIFQDQGFAIRAAHDIAPDLLPPEGVLTREQPDAVARTNATRAAEAMTALGPADIGQGCVTSFGQVIAVEAKFGTDWMLQSLENRPDGPGGLLYKAPKPGQDRRIDLPTIGPDTITAITRANLHGIVIEADGVMVLDLEKTIAEADRRQRFLWIRTP